MTTASEAIPTETSASALRETPSMCEFELRVFDKYTDVERETAGETLSIAITNGLPDFRHLSHSRAIFGARRMVGRRTYGCYEVWFPDEDERPPEGYDHFAVRKSVTFEDKIEVFDVLSEFDEAEGILRYRAQDLGDDSKDRVIIANGVKEYLDAAYQVMLWDPKSKLDIAEGLNDLFLDRDWTAFVSPDDLKVPAVSISDVELVQQASECEWLVRFQYVNGDQRGWELEFADVKRGRLCVRRNSFSALRSPVPAFRGDQLPSVYDALQKALDGMQDQIRSVASA